MFDYLHAFSSIAFSFFFFLRPHPQHMEVPGQGLNRSYSCQPTSQLKVMPDTRPTEQDEGSNLHPHGYQSDSFPTVPQWEFPFYFLIFAKNNNYYNFIVAMVIKKSLLENVIPQQKGKVRREAYISVSETTRGEQLFVCLFYFLNFQNTFGKI